jgi:hypothetical protein
MPDIEPPEDLSCGPLDIETVENHVAHEGLGFTVYSLIPAERISDPQLRKLWWKTRAAMQEVVEYLETIH